MSTRWLFLGEVRESRRVYVFARMPVISDQHTEYDKGSAVYQEGLEKRRR
jgi:hypothetical protein